jgi:hypothetical protein
MKARALLESASFDPAQLAILGAAFDAAWAKIAPTVGSYPLSIEAARLQLADAVLQAAKSGFNSPDGITKRVLAAMSVEQRAV